MAVAALLSLFLKSPHEPTELENKSKNYNKLDNIVPSKNFQNINRVRTNQQQPQTFTVSDTGQEEKDNAVG